MGTSDIEKLYDKLRYSKFVKEHSSSGIFSSLFQLKSRSYEENIVGDGDLVAEEAWEMELYYKSNRLPHTYI